MTLTIAPAEPCAVKFPANPPRICTPMAPLVAKDSMVPEVSTELLELIVTAAPGSAMATCPPSSIVILPGLLLLALAVSKGVLTAVLLLTVKLSARAIWAMPASNAKELTPQISELRVKLNPAQDEFCL